VNEKIGDDRVMTFFDPIAESGWFPTRVKTDEESTGQRQFLFSNANRHSINGLAVVNRS